MSAEPSMTAGEFIRTLVAFGSKLRPSAASDGDARRKYVEELVSLARALKERESKSSDTDAFRDIIMPNVDTIMRVIAGAQALRRRALPAETRAAIDALGTPLDMLGLIAQQRSEVAHTRALGSFLQCHDSPFPELAKNCALRLERLLSDAQVRAGRSALPALDLDLASADCEQSLPSGDRLDVALSSPKSLVYIEAKVDAGERVDQLEDYGTALAAAVASSSRHGVLVFLTVDDDQKTTTTHEHVHITFRDLLLAWLPVAASGCRGAGDLARYLKTIATHLYRVSADGAFDEWPLHTQRACLRMLEKGLAA